MLQLQVCAKVPGSVTIFLNLGDPWKSANGGKTKQQQQKPSSSESTYIQLNAEFFRKIKNPPNVIHGPLPHSADLWIESP